MQNILAKAPIELPVMEVRPEWVDRNGHMNVGFYLRAFTAAVGPAYEAMGIGWTYVRAGGGTTFTLESRVRYVREVFGGDPLAVTLQLLDLDEKRLHAFARMYHARDGYLAASLESLITHASLETRRTCPFPPALYESLRTLVARHRELPYPEGLDAPIGIRRRKA
jgi:acyl-CoA thioester hydrolase